MYYAKKQGKVNIYLIYRKRNVLDINIWWKDKMYATGKQRSEKRKKNNQLILWMLEIYIYILECSMDQDRNTEWFVCKMKKKKGCNLEREKSKIQMSNEKKDYVNYK